MNEPTTTISGNLTDDPQLRFTGNGLAVASFTIASTPRFKTGDGWSDGQTWYVHCSAWRELGENIAESLRKGSAVIAHGRLTARTYETTDKATGQKVKRTAVEMTVDDLGPSLRRATARPAKTTREHAASTRPAPASDPWATSAPPSGRGTDAQPPF